MTFVAGNTKRKTIILIIVFTVLLTFAIAAQPYYKNDVQIYLTFAGLVVFISRFAKPPFKTSIPFYMLLFYIIYIANFISTQYIVNLINPNDGWVEFDGKRGRVMQMNWMYGFFTGFIVAPSGVFIYRKKAERNLKLEAGFSLVFIVSCMIIYIISNS